MPATHLTKKYCEPKTQPTDKVKALILERVNASGLRHPELRKILNCCEKTLSTRLNGSTRDWSLGEILDLCQAVGVPIDELRAAIRYK